MNIRIRRIISFESFEYCHSNHSFSAFTLVELLIVLLIIGLLSGVTLRAIDMTRERSMYSETAKKLNELTEAMIGKSDLISDGRRVDFGFVGDMGRLPQTLDELVKNTENSSNWNGPYIKITFLEDTANPSFKRDAWGNEIVYSPSLATISSRGNDRITMTHKITDSLSFILNNRVSGLITDNDNNPPGNYSSNIDVVIEKPDGPTTPRHPNNSGYFQIDTVPIGKHPIRVIRRTASPETLTKWVSVVPKSNTFLDFKFTSSFRSNLIYVDGSAITLLGDTSSLQFEVFNPAGETIKLTSLKFDSIIKAAAPCSAYCEKIRAGGNEVWNYSGQRAGQGDNAVFTQNVTICPSAKETFTFLNFYNDPYPGSDSLVKMDSVNFKLIFSDHSIIKFLTTIPRPF